MVSYSYGSHSITPSKKIKRIITKTQQLRYTI